MYGRHLGLTTSDTAPHRAPVSPISNNLIVVDLWGGGDSWEA